LRASVKCPALPQGPKTADGFIMRASRPGPSRLRPGWLRCDCQICA
jgi:hypothetical protein